MFFNKIKQQLNFLQEDVEEIEDALFSTEMNLINLKAELRTEVSRIEDLITNYSKTTDKAFDILLDYLKVEPDENLKLVPKKNHTTATKSTKSK